MWLPLVVVHFKHVRPNSFREGLPASQTVFYNIYSLTDIPLPLAESRASYQIEDFLPHLKTLPTGEDTAG